MSLRVVSIRRYPVKAMGGESLESVDIDGRGLVGDRAWAVRDEESRLACGKNGKRFVRHDRVFEYAARTTAEGVEISGPAGTWIAGDTSADAALAADFDASVRVAAENDVKHFDDSPISLIGTATLEWCARELGIDADPRRLRVNLVVETERPFEEEEWDGHIRIGSAELATVKRVTRCRTIDLAQDGVDGQTSWLKALGATRDLKAAVYLSVVTPGVIAVGDAVES
ncbi:MOSC domain-containing protein [Demequina sediminicola]|uniref:MOSC domain-containing protein n=1 Tax=Demequina sediminicola TaxID=1095026 RepID=UPI0009E3605D|nr:MOSC N-terminal beta barrel domain-containing protein [Demequina sediminicola]